METLDRVSIIMSGRYNAQTVSDSFKEGIRIC